MLFLSGFGSLGREIVEDHDARSRLQGHKKESLAEFTEKHQGPRSVEKNGRASYDFFVSYALLRNGK